MKKILLIFFVISIFHLTNAESDYDRLINEEVTEEYCSYVIGNISELIKDGYVFYDFFKEPIQPEGLPNYITKIDFIEELKKVKTTNRTYFEFLRDIEDILEKANDNHLDIYGFRTPNSFKLNEYYYCIPFNYEVKENYNETNETVITLKYNKGCNTGYSDEIINKIKSLEGIKIESINEMGPFEYFSKIGEKGYVFHSPQARYVFGMQRINQLPINIFPFKKEELDLSIKFEGKDELFKIEYQFKHKDDIGGDFFEFFYNSAFLILENNLQSPNSNSEKKSFQQNNDDLWDIKNSNEIIKCKVDDKNNLNVMHVSGFYPIDIDDFDTTMDECFTRFYSNNYKLVVIYAHNFGGRAESCVPFVQYLFPKITKPFITAKKSNDFISKTFFKDDKIINPKTCRSYTEADEPSKGEQDTYGDNIIHKKTQYLDYLNIFQQKLMYKTRDKYLESTKMPKKPTEIILFTDGLSLSCASISLRKLQLYGLGIIVGYNIRPDLINKTIIDASQSSSSVSYYDYSEYVQNLKKLGFYLMLTDKEQFDTNDYKEKVRTPMEFKVYPPDIISDIYLPYNDNIYERFIEKAKSIFEEYNEKEKCNKENKFLFYETKECDSELKIEHAHGGYVCGDNGVWNKSHCIAAYCDNGYILNDERTQCIEDPCKSINLQEISIKEAKEYDINPNNIYIFTVDNKNMNYSIYSDIDNLLFVYNFDNVLVPVENGTIFENGKKIYANFYLNVTDNIKIKVKESKPEEDEKKQDDNQDKNKFPIWAIILIIVGVLIIIVILIIILKMRKKPNSDSIEEKSERLHPIES